MKLRSSEWVLIAYFLYTAGCALTLTVRPTVQWVTLAINALILGGLILLAYSESLRHQKVLRVLRDWYPLPLMLLAYREMGWFAPETHSYTLEQSWIVYDRLLLNQWGLRAIVELLGPLIPSLLEISYSLVYAIAPFCMGWLYANRKVDRMDHFLTPFLTGIFLSYVLFPFFPSEPPRTVFQGEDLPRILTLFREFNLGLVGNYGIHMSVFPSAHCSGAFAAAFAMREAVPENRWLWRTLLLLAISIATATVYGRYHYAVDAVAGIAISLIAWLVARKLRI